MTTPRVKLDDVTRRFGDLVAVDGASVELVKGSLHAIVGENGAGKSTLLKMAAGLLAPSRGRVIIDGRALDPATPDEALRRGVGMVHQHFMLVGAFRAIENLMLGSEPTRGPFLDEATAKAKAKELARATRLDVPLDAITDELTVGQRQRLEILRVLMRGADAILLDEPTAVLSPLEAQDLYATLAGLKASGKTIAVVTHRLDEVTRFADEVTVMRRGKVVLGASARDADEALLTRAIMGGDAPEAVEPAELAHDAEVAIAIRGLTVVDDEGRRALDGIDLDVKRGEIVGVAGVEGNGQRELVRAIAGLEPRAHGAILVGGVDVSKLDVRARRARIATVHEDRHVEGLLLDRSVHENLIFGDLGDGDEAFDEARVAARRLEDWDVRPRDLDALASSLSGGNQQKIVVGRALDRAAHRKIAFAAIAQPTRGVDVGAAALLHRGIRDAAARGVAVLVVSADLAELQRLSHKIVVVRRGKIVAAFPRGASVDAIGRAMIGLEAA